MNKELMESMNILEKEYNISKDTLLEALRIHFSQPARTTLAKPTM